MITGEEPTLPQVYKSGRRRQISSCLPQPLDVCKLPGVPSESLLWLNAPAPWRQPWQRLTPPEEKAPGLIDQREILDRRIFRKLPGAKFQCKPMFAVVQELGSVMGSLDYSEVV
jgi:hypothetical protein